MYSFGYNGNNNLGLGDVTNRTTPQKITFAKKVIKISSGYDHSLILTDDGEVYGFGFNGHG